MLLLETNDNFKLFFYSFVGSYEGGTTIVAGRSYQIFHSRLRGNYI